LPEFEEISEGVYGVGKILILGGFGHSEVVEELIEGNPSCEGLIWRCELLVLGEYWDEVLGGKDGKVHGWVTVTCVAPID
jgi:hypothetical protein